MVKQGAYDAPPGRARAVVDSVSSGVIPRATADDYCILVGVFIHWDAKDDQNAVIAGRVTSATT